MARTRRALADRNELLHRDWPVDLPMVASVAVCAAALTMAALPGSPQPPAARATSLEAAYRVELVPGESRLRDLDIRPGSLIVVTPAGIEHGADPSNRPALVATGGGYVYDVRPPRDMVPWFVALLVAVAGLLIHLVTPTGPLAGAHLATWILAGAYAGWPDEPFAAALAVAPLATVAIPVWPALNTPSHRTVLVLAIAASILAVGLGHLGALDWTLSRLVVASLAILVLLAHGYGWVARTMRALAVLHGADVGRWPRSLLLRQLIAEGLGGSAPTGAAAERERHRLAAALHLDVLPRLERLKAALAHEPAAQWEVQAVEDRLRAGLVARHPVGLDAFGLIVGLEGLVEQVETVEDVRIELRIDQEDGRPPRPVERAAFQVASLAMDNAIQRGMARSIEVAVSIDHELARLTVTDDGKGFSSDDAVRAARAGRLGLAQMIESAKAVGASVTWEIRGGSGARVRFEWIG